MAVKNGSSKKTKTNKSDFFEDDLLKEHEVTLVDLTDRVEILEKLVGNKTNFAKTFQNSLKESATMQKSINDHNLDYFEGLDSKVRKIFGAVFSAVVKDKILWLIGVFIGLVVTSYKLPEIIDFFK